MLSIDVGYGNTKAYNGSDRVIFPSVYKRRGVGYYPKNDNIRTIELDGVTYDVGRYAYIREGCSPFNREDMFRYKIFILYAICEITNAKGFSGEVAMGLPIGDYIPMGDKVKKLTGKYTVRYNDKECSIDITKIIVYEQSKVVYKLLKKSEASIKNNTIGIIDIGQKNLGFAYYQKGKYIREWSGSMAYGVIDAYHYIEKALQEKAGIYVIDYSVMDYVKHVPEEAQKAFSDLATMIKDRLIRRHWDFAKMDIYIIGGGTSYVAPYFKNAKYTLLDGEMAIFANAYAYYEGDDNIPSV